MNLSFKKIRIMKNNKKNKKAKIIQINNKIRITKNLSKIINKKKKARISFFHKHKGRNIKRKILKQRQVFRSSTDK